MKIVFMGTPQAAVSSLARLLADGHTVTAVYTQPDRPSGRGKKIVYSPVKEFALKNHLPVFQPEKIRNPEVIKTVCSHQADISVVVAYGRILPLAILNAFPLGAINLHFSLLPKYRGAAPVNWAIVNGDKVTGVTTMKMDEGLDTGDILLQKTVEIGADETAVELTMRLAETGACLLSETLAKINELTPSRQDEKSATFAPILSKADGRIGWSMDAGEIAARIRGFQPFPMAYGDFRGSRLTLWKAAKVESEAGFALSSAGNIASVEKKRLIVQCGNITFLRIDELQIEGKRRITAAEFINGMRPNPGEKLG
ncbi:MAG TPA: methionyl-tRNA formyltransferase [Blastocatellia bacterium]|nr:methionyl-tRNA formyltransferase [Blastocatellia bacterium]